MGAGAVFLLETHGLERKLGLFSVTNIVIANIIGAGIFTTTGLLMGDLNNPVLMLVLWVAGGIIALCGALSYSELGAAIPEAGGEYLFLSRLYHPLIGFLSGWVSFMVGFSAPIAASAMGFTVYFSRAFPQLFEWGNAVGALNPEISEKILSVFTILLFTAIHMMGLEIGAKIQNYLTLLKVGLVVGFILLGFSLGIFPILSVTGVFRLRYTNKSQYKLPGYPFVPIIFILSGFLMLVLSFFERPVESSIAILTVIAGIPAFFMFRRRL